MFKLYKDKPNVFEAKITLEGASLSNSSCRIVLESQDWDYVFKGTVDSQGNCNIPIKKVAGILDENSKGTMRLEVIADDTYFTPWEDAYVVDVSKKLKVEVVESNSTITNKPKVSVSLTEKTKHDTPKVSTPSPKLTNQTLEEEFIISDLKESGVTANNMKTKKSLKVIKELIENYEISGEKMGVILKKYKDM